MKIFYDFNKKLDDDVKEALRLLETDGSKRREHFHILTGFSSLYAISVPGTRFKARVILKHHGHNVYEYVFTDNGHKYPAAFLKNLDKLEFREGLKPLLGDTMILDQALQLHQVQQQSFQILSLTITLEMG